MSCKEVRVGDIGVTFRGRIVDRGSVVDILTQTTIELRFKGPTGAVKTQGASLTTDGTDGLLEYVTAAAGDIDEAGRWSWQAHVILSGGGDYSSEVHTFEVEAVLA